MPRSASKIASTRTGKLRIGDEWNAINIIARSQPRPLKAVCELVENAIDARATHVVITRRRTKKQVFLEVADNGGGVSLNEDGEPDFRRIATHVCDSMKRHLSHESRSGIHGEFGIGLLSFWSLGDTLRMISDGASGMTYEMELRSGNNTYHVRTVRGRLLNSGGTRVVIGPLVEAARKVVSGEKLARYLASELRDRIRASGVVVEVDDRLLRKKLVVKPQEFLGERITGLDWVPTEFGPIRIELYFANRADNTAEGVAVCKDGTRVLAHIADLDSFQNSPWTDGTLEGVIDFAALALSPGTRAGIVPDKHLDAFVAAMEQIEPALIEAMQARENARTEKASEQILRQLKKAFVTALRELPSSEYLFFDLPKSQAGMPADAQRKGGGDQGGLDVEISQPVAETNQPDEFDGQIPLPFAPGPLASVKIRPNHPRSRPGEACFLRAIPLDENGQPPHGAITYQWRVVEGAGTLEGDGETCRVVSAAEGLVDVQVEATQEATAVSAQCAVKFLNGGPATSDEQPQGLPTYRIAAEHASPWRSRYDEKRNQIVINSAHRDFIAAQVPLSKHRRYIGKLYAKEVVLINFPHESPATVMERLIELTLRTEDSL